MRRKPETRLRSLEAIRLERYASYAALCKFYTFKLADIYDMTVAEHNGFMHRMNKEIEASNNANTPTRKKR